MDWLGLKYCNDDGSNDKGKPVNKSDWSEVWKDGSVEFLFKDHNKMNTPFVGALPLDITEDRRVLFARKISTNRFRLYVFDRKNQQEVFLKEITDNCFYID